MKMLFQNTIPFYKRLALIFCIFTVTRLVFLLINLSYFPDFELAVLFQGLRFDLVAIVYLFMPFLLLHLIPVKNNAAPWRTLLLSVFFQIGLHLSLLANYIDTIYFNFTFKRSTADVFLLAGTGNDVLRLIPQFLKDFWYMIIVYLVSVFLFTKFYCKIKERSLIFTLTPLNWVFKSAGLLIGLSFFIIGARGGLQLRPLNMADTSKYASGSNTAVLVNTPFSILLTLQNPGVEKISYFKSTQLEKLYTPIQKINGSGYFTGRNVVVLILESFGEEYVGFLSGKKTYTPFLDSLFNKSYVFKNNRANGLKSIEALPSILSGLPSLNNTPFILSPYSSNQIESLPNRLKEKGYISSFFHAGETGTMGFDAFCKSVGIDDYYGLEDYPDRKKDFDGNWGIYDEHYLQYFAQKLNSFKQPFFSSVFTLSSHHPYSIPIKYEGVFDQGNLNVHETIGYTDMALRKFFLKVKNESWFKNTIFILTADHPAQSEFLFYKKDNGRFKVPLAFYVPNSTLRGESDKLAKQADIPSTVLGMIGDTNEVLNFGNDLFSSNEGIVLNYKNSNYIIRNQSNVLVFNGRSAIGYYAEEDSLWQTNLMDSVVSDAAYLKLLNKGKAYLQQYNNRLINNQLIQR